MNKKEPSKAEQTANQLQADAMQAAIIYLTVKLFVDKHKAFKIGGLRALIFNEHQNGLAKSGAIIRISRKVLIDEAKFFAWIESQNQGGAR